MTDVQLFIDADTTPVNQRSNLYLWDHFNADGPCMNWEQSLSGSGAMDSVADPGENHPGVCSLATGSTGSSVAEISQLNLYESRLTSLEWVFRLLDSTSLGFSVGAWTSGISDGFYVGMSTASGDSALSLCKIISGSRTVGATLALNTAHWYRAIWTRTGSGAGTLTLDDLDAATSANYSVSGLPAGANFRGGASIVNLSAANKTLYLDWFKAALVGMDS